LVGRWGIRVGDRVSVSGVTGDVIDVGLVRFYMMELAGTGLDFHPTGRIVVFANSVLFQPNTPLFKQLPGTEYTLHEVVVGLSPGANYKAVQEWLLNTVNSVYARFRGEIERQHEAIEARLDIRVTLPATEGRLQLTDGGLEFLVRYPVEIGRAAEIDEDITRAVLETLDKDAGLKAAVPGLPKIRAVVRG
jgi:small-conductance mechanosensitive channel